MNTNGCFPLSFFLFFFLISFAASIKIETSTAVVEDRRRYLMSAKENQCNEIHYDKPRINGFASTAGEINGHPEDQVKGHEVMGSSASKSQKF